MVSNHWEREAWQASLGGITVSPVSGVRRSVSAVSRVSRRCGFAGPVGRYHGISGISGITGIMGLLVGALVGFPRLSERQPLVSLAEERSGQMDGGAVMLAQYMILAAGSGDWRGRRRSGSGRADE